MIKIVHDDRVEYYNDDNQLHRDENEGPAIEWNNGDKEYYYQGVKHRNVGPACVYVGNDFMTRHSYYVEGELHRLDGPAVEWRDYPNDYYIYGKKYSEWINSHLK